MGKTEELRAESVNVIIEKRCRDLNVRKILLFYEQWPYWNLTRLFQVGFSFASTDGSFSNTKRIVIDRIIYIDVVFLQQNILLTFISYQLIKKKNFFPHYWSLYYCINLKYWARMTNWTSAITTTTSTNVAVSYLVTTGGACLVLSI